MLVRPEKHLYKQMDMVGHHTELHRLQDWIFVREMNDGFRYYLSYVRFLYFCAARSAGGESCISGNFAEDFAMRGLFDNYVIDERGMVIMRESPAMIGMLPGFRERPYFCGAHDTVVYA